MAQDKPAEHDERGKVGCEVRRAEMDEGSRDDPQGPARRSRHDGERSRSPRRDHPDYRTNNHGGRRPCDETGGRVRKKSPEKAWDVIHSGNGETFRRTGQIVRKEAEIPSCGD